MALIVSKYDIKTETLIPLVTFIMDGKKLKADWEPNSQGFRQDLETNGIVGPGPEFIAIYPKDGKAFYDNLEMAFSNSTLIHVVPSGARFADKNLDFMTIYDKDGNQVS